MGTAREPAVAGLFYPRQGSQLRRQVAELLSQAPSGGPVPAALIVPHAGYQYSGSVAAAGYAAISPGSFDRVLLIGPAHRVAFAGLALPGHRELATPLGVLVADEQLTAQALTFDQVHISRAAHAQEHSVEVHLPFLQTVFGSIPVLALLAGQVSVETVAEVILALGADLRTLVVISSDLSHYLDDASAQQLDDLTVQQILNLDGSLAQEQACGATSINGMLLAAKELHLQPRLLDLRNSGDTAGDRRRVVGYAAIAFERQGMS